MNCCFSSKHSGQVTVQPSETFIYTCELSIKKPGPFEAPMTLFLEENGIREVRLTVRGVGVASGRTSDASDEKEPP